MLSRENRLAVRQLALEFYCAEFESGVVIPSKIDSVIRVRFAEILGPILIDLAIKLAIRLIQYWISKRLDPAAVSYQYQPQEPGYYDAEEEPSPA